MKISIKSRIKTEIESNPEFAQAYHDCLFAEEFAQTLQDLRKTMHLSQSELANRTGIKQVEISKIENLKTIPTVSTMDRLLRVFNKRLSIINQ